MTVHLVSGHDMVRDSGAVSDHPILGKIKEASLTREYKHLLKKELEFLGVPFTLDDDKDDLRTVISKLKSKVKPDDLVIDIHFNSVDNPKANGTETFTKDKPSLEEWEIAREMNDIMWKTMGTKNRGVKKASQSARGRLGIMTLPCMVILIEIGFISNPEDVNKFVKWKFIMSARHADFLSDYKK